MELIYLSFLSSTTHAYTNENKIMDQSTRFTTINISVKRRLLSNSCSTRYTTLSTFYLIQNSLWNLWLLNQSNFPSFQWISSSLWPFQFSTYQEKKSFITQLGSFYSLLNFLRILLRYISISTHRSRFQFTQRSTLQRQNFQ